MAVARVDCKDEKGSNVTLFACSLYCNINYRQVIYPNLRKLMELVNDKQGQLLLMMDSNSHSVLWGELKTNPRGAKFENFIAHHGLVVNNTGTNATYFHHNASSIVDVILSTP